MAIILTKDNFNQEVLESDKPVIVDFWADRCTPCKMIAPVLDEIAEERSDVKICKVDVDSEFELAMQYGIMSIPTLIAFDKGEISGKIIGAVGKAEIEKLIK